MTHPDYKVLYDTSLKKKMNVVTFLTIVVLFGAWALFMQYDIFERYPLSGFLLFTITVGLSATYYCWKIIRYRCPKCGVRIPITRDSNKSIITFDCADCHIIWDSKIGKTNT